TPSHQQLEKILRPSTLCKLINPPGGPDCGPSNPLQNLLKHSNRHLIPSQFEHTAHQQASSHSTQAHLHGATPWPRPPISSMASAKLPPWQKQFIGHSMKHSVSMDKMACMECSFCSVQPSSQAPPAMHWSQQFAHNHN
ncbi:hypothetical protein PCANC_23409, partial [Puccinia coronata f. sp. avenae]